MTLFVSALRVLRDVWVTCQGQHKGLHRGFAGPYRGLLVS